MAKTKGATSFVNIPMAYLRDHIPVGATVPVSRIWLRNNGIVASATKVETVRIPSIEIVETKEKEDRIAFTIHK